MEMELSDVRITSIHEMRDWPVWVPEEEYKEGGICTGNVAMTTRDWYLWEEVDVRVN